MLHFYDVMFTKLVRVCLAVIYIFTLNQQINSLLFLTHAVQTVHHCKGDFTYLLIYLCDRPTRRQWRLLIAPRGPVSRSLGR